MEENAEDPSKHPLSDEERKKLAVQLDSDLDAFISGLEKRSYTEGWPEDRWEEEMEKHPFFMTKPPQDGDPLPPLLEGIQQLKYDPNENTPEELAENYKQDGNFNFKCKKYRRAIISYTEGLKCRCNNVELNAQLHNNRSAAHFFLKNYRSALMDCQLAVKLKPDYEKAISRAAQCTLAVKHLDECLQWCDRGLQLDPTDKSFLDLRAKAAQQKKLQERDKRKKAVDERKEQKATNDLLEAVKSRNIQVHKSGELTVSDLTPQHPAAARNPVHLDGDSLIWPVIFLYPEYATTDFIEKFHEESTFEEHLSEMFDGESPPEWDEERKYTVPDLRLYYEHSVTGKLHEVPKSSSLKEALSDKQYILQGGLPMFMVIVKDSKAEQTLLDRYR